MPEPTSEETAISEIQKTTMGPFKDWPADSVIEDFRAHVLETGRPDTWVHHTASKPPADDDYHEVISFAIPQSKRADVGMASCPICSPSAPKYYEGSLAFFPSEGVLRAIGHECAKAHFGHERAANAKVERQRRLAENFLLDELPKHCFLGERAARLEAPAAAADDLRAALFRAASKAGWQRVARLGAAGFLPIEEVEDVHVVDGYGRGSTVQRSRVVETVEVTGLSFLMEQNSTLLAAQNAIGAAGQVAACTVEEALELVVALSPDLDHLLEAERLLRAAVMAVEQLERKIAEAAAFVSPSNLQRLNDWTHDNRVDVGVVVSFSPYGQFKVRGSQGSWRVLTLPPCAVWPSA
jgi:hypothetical protein